MRTSAAETLSEGQPAARKVEIDFLFIDLTTCSRCLGTEASLEAALDLVQAELEAAGVEVEVRRTLIESEGQARALRFVSSPTIRVNGRDIALETKESQCGSCGEVSGEATDCRVWAYRGQEHTAAPVELIAEAILREADEPRPAPAPESAAYREVPENLKRFFAGKARKAAEASSSCCAPAEQAACCAPSEKADCCGMSDSQGCGCR